MKITLKLTPDEVFATVKLLRCMKETFPNTREKRAAVSIWNCTQKKFEKVAETLISNGEVFSRKNRKNISLDVHECIFVSDLVRISLPAINDQLSRVLLRSIADEIDQKLA